MRTWAGSRRRSRPASAPSPRARPPIDPVATAVLPRVAVPEARTRAPRPRRPGGAAALGGERGRAPRAKDFAEYSDAERATARAILARMARRGPTRLGRRTRAVARRGSEIDQRATLRASLRHAGEPLERRWREPRPQLNGGWCWSATSPARWTPTRGCCSPTPTPASRLGKRCEAFAFSTRLTRITRELSRRDPDAAVRRAARFGRRLVGRHANRRRDRRAQPRARPAPRSRLRRRDPLRRLGPGRRRGARARDRAARALLAPARLAQPAEGERRGTSRWYAG